MRGNHFSKSITHIAVFASGRGSNFRAVLQKTESAELKNARVAVVISNNSRSGSLALAQEKHIPAYHISSHTHPVPEEYEKALLAILKSHEVGLILLAGYMKLLPSSIIRSFPERILNIHPALLPRHGGKGMYGVRVHQAVIDAGEKETGVTVHIVNEHYDEGPIVAQRRLPVRADDTAESLAARVLEVEHDLYWRAVDHLLNGTPVS
jgi:phosphoribosylglycinamide formyltransferase-1